MIDLKGNVAIVTGATRGIGKATAEMLAGFGCTVIAVYHTREDLAKKLPLINKQIFPIKADVCSEKEIKDVITFSTDKFHGIDILVNNAGIDIFGEIEQYRSSDWDTMIDTNVKSIFLFSKYSIPYLKKSKNPVIVNTASRIGYSEYTEQKFVVYGVTKAGVINFTSGLSKELLPYNIRVNAVIPTPTKTDLFDEVFTPEEEKELRKKGKLGMPEDTAKLIVELITDKSANGKILFDKRVSF
jgi:3-oxoacyl-[acyl-carrier protein] reductase